MKDKESGFYYYRVRFYDPNTGRFLQKDPEPGKLDFPGTVINPYLYAGNNPIMYKDPTGGIFGIDDFVFFLILGASISGAIGAEFNYDAAKRKGLSDSDVLSSTILGFITGALTAGLSIAMPALAPLWGGLGSFINNVGNQFIERKDFSKINWGRATGAAFFGAVSTFLIGTVFKAIPGVDRVLTAEGQALISGPFGALAGYCVDFGFGSDEEVELYCGLKVKFGSPVQQGTY